MKKRIAKRKPSQKRGSPPDVLDDLRWGLDVPGRRDIVKLKKHLLSIGGERFQRNDFLADELSRPMVKTLLTSGKLLPCKGAKLRRMEPSNCHENASRLSKQGFERWTGLALSSDGIWRMHSWASENSHLIETTERRTHYFGICLTAPVQEVRSGRSSEKRK